MFSSTDRELAEHVARISHASLLSRVPNSYDGSTRKRYWAVNVSGRQVIERLEALGLQPRKSLTASMPDVPHPDAFVRGYFDGNGHVGFYRNPSCRPDALPRLRATIVGAEKLLSGVQETLQAAKIVPKKLGKATSVKRIDYNHLDCLRLANFMYADGGPHLIRKKQHFDEGAAQPFPNRRKTYQ